MIDLGFAALRKLRQCNQNSVKMSEVVKLLCLEQIGFSNLEVRSTAVEEDSDVLEAEKLGEDRD